jgi:hypothetical protein
MLLNKKNNLGGFEMELEHRNLTTCNEAVSHHRLSNAKCIQTASLLLLTGHGDHCTNFYNVLTEEILVYYPYITIASNYSTSKLTRTARSEMC